MLRVFLLVVPLVLPSIRARRMCDRSDLAEASSCDLRARRRIQSRVLHHAPRPGGPGGIDGGGIDGVMLYLLPFGSSV